jgi:Cft2 family RNA processing exonuclease
MGTIFEAQNRQLIAAIDSLHAIACQSCCALASPLPQVNDFKFLLDCGWDHNYDVALLEPVKAVLSTVDAVLLSHPDPLHLGALPYLVGRLGLQVCTQNRTFGP